MTFAEAQEYLRPSEYRRPPNYIGEEHYGTYSAYAVHRDSDPIDRANFQVMDELVTDASADVLDNDLMPYITRESHWAVGWLDTLRVPMENESAVIALAEAMQRLEDYPILDEDLVSTLEWEENEAAGMVVDPVTGEWVYPDELEDDHDYVGMLLAGDLDEYPYGVEDGCSLTDDD
jgi:hypothetical protein